MARWKVALLVIGMLATFELYIIGIAFMAAAMQ